MIFITSLSVMGSVKLQKMYKVEVMVKIRPPQVMRSLKIFAIYLLKT